MPMPISLTSSCGIWRNGDIIGAPMPDQEDAVKVFTEAIHAMPQMIQNEWAAVFAAKLGVAEATETDAQLARDL